MTDICAWKVLKTIEIWQILFAQTIGTAFLMLGGCAGALAWYGPKPSHFVPSITFGLAVMMIIQSYGHLPGGHPHINPLITFAAVLFRMISVPVTSYFLKKKLHQNIIFNAGVYFLFSQIAILCFLAQMIGATIGYWILMVIAPYKMFETISGDFGVCQTFLHEDLSILQGFSLNSLRQCF